MFLLYKYTVKCIKQPMLSYCCIYIRNLFERACLRQWWEMESITFPFLRNPRSRYSDFESACVWDA